MELYIKHKNNMDVCYKVIKLHNFSESPKIKIKCILCNQGFDTTFVLWPVPVNLKIKRENIKNWLCFRNYDLICVRYGNWLPLQNIVAEVKNV